MKYMPQRVYRKWLEQGYKPAFSGRMHIKNGKLYQEMTIQEHEQFVSVFPDKKAMEIWNQLGDSTAQEDR